METIVDQLDAVNSNSFFKEIKNPEKITNLILKNFNNETNWEELNKFTQLKEIGLENCLIDKTDSSKYINSRFYAKERIKDCFRKIIYKLAPSKKRDKFDYEHFSDLVNFVELANNHYQSNIKCKKITDGCYCIYK